MVTDSALGGEVGKQPVISRLRFLEDVGYSGEVFAVGNVPSKSQTKNHTTGLFRPNLRSAMALACAK
jgi:hypothetical protein